jgi:receptor protein-tyrosine kinase
LFDRKQQPGLTEILLDRRSRTEVVLRGAAPGPLLIPSGATTENASELLSLPAFKQFVDSLRKDFDWLVIDSPPVMAVTDATVLAHGASAVLFVTCADKTTLEAADTAIGELAAVGARFVGAVLNRVPLTREAYYYSRYYRPEYSAYFAPQRGPLGAMTREKKRPVEVATGRVPSASSGAPGESISPSL